MATASPTTASNATRRKGGKRPASEPTNGPSTISAVNEGSGTSAKKPKIEPTVAQKTKIKKEQEDASTNKTLKKAKESGTIGDEQQDKENHDNRQTLVFNWTAEELSQLIGNLSNCLPKTDNVKYSTLIDKLDWEKVRFPPYTASECKDKWTQIMTRLRRFRTLTDMVTDAKEWLKHPWSSYSSSKKQKHPEMPKKPLTPYFRYFLEKRQKYSREHPDMSMTDLAKVLSKKYQQLPEKKKQKYKETYERENEIYKQELEKFKKEHPDQFPSSDVKQQHTLHEGPNRPQTPFQHFFLDRIKKAEFADMDKKEMTDKARKMWSSLSQAKKVKWIKKAEQEQQKYLVEVDEYCQSHPNYKPESFRSVLSKAEKEMKDRYDGKPEKPPNSGYSLFSRVMLRQLTDVPSKQKMSEISRRWKELSEKERLTYIDSAQKQIAEYRVNYANYLKSLPEEERQKLENETKNSKKKTVVEASPSPESDEKKSVCNENDTDGASSRQKKPAVFYYQQEKIASFRQKHPELSKQELMKLLAKDYNELPEKKKEKYKKLAEETKQQDSSKVKSVKSVKNKVQETGSRKQRLYKGEPRKPPASGYSLFTTETLGSIGEGDSKNRMSAVAAKWNTLSEAEKEKYKKRSREMMKKYKADFAKFVAGLSEAEREEYNELRSVKRGGGKQPASKSQKGQTPAAKTAQTKHKRKAESESSDESSGDDEEEEEDDDDEEEEDDDDEGSDKSGNEEESGSDESGSDSDDDENDDDDDSDEDSDEEKKDGDNDSSSGESGSESDSNSGSSDNSSESGSESDD